MGVAIELDEKRLELCRNNARIYGVEDKIEFIHGDAFEVLKTLKDVDSIFLAPPWGGMLYGEKRFDIRKMGVNGVDVFKAACAVTPNIAYFVPRNVDRSQMISLAGPGQSVSIEENRVNNKVKSITAYYGSLVPS